MITEFVKKHGKTIATVVAPAIGAAIGSVCQIIKTKKECRKLEAETAVVEAAMPKKDDVVEVEANEVTEVEEEQEIE